MSDNGNHHLISKIDHFTVSFGVNKLRELMQLPEADARPGVKGFEVFDDLPELIASMTYLGYSGELTNISLFNTLLYNTLFTILNRCLTRKNCG